MQSASFLVGNFRVDSFSNMAVRVDFTVHVFEALGEHFLRIERIDGGWIQLRDSILFGFFHPRVAVYANRFSADVHGTLCGVHRRLARCASFTISGVRAARRVHLFDFFFAFAQRSVAAFLAISERRDRLRSCIRFSSPALPPLEPSFLKNSRTSGGSVFSSVTNIA